MTSKKDVTKRAPKTVKYDEDIYLTLGEEFVSEAEEGRRWYPTLGSDKVKLQFINGIDEVKSGDVVIIRTEEEVVGSYNLLGNFAGKWCYYWPAKTNERPVQLWTIELVADEKGVVVHYGDTVTFRNGKNVGKKYLAKKDEYLTTRIEKHAAKWKVAPVPATNPPGGEEITYGSNVVLRHSNGRYIAGAIKKPRGFFASLKTTGAVAHNLTNVAGRMGAVKDGDKLRINTTESFSGGQSQLASSKLSLGSCYYAKPDEDYKRYEWIIQRRDAAKKGAIKQGEDVRFVNVLYSGKHLVRNDANQDYLATVKKSSEWWVIQIDGA